MKNTMLISALLVLLIFMVTGCTKIDKVTCIKTEINSNYTTFSSLNVIVKDNQVINVDMLFTMKTNSTNRNKRQTLIDYYTTYFKKNDDELGTNTDIKETDEGIKATFSLNGKDAKEYFNKESDISKDEIIEMYTKQGYTCK